MSTAATRRGHRHLRAYPYCNDRFDEHGFPFYRVPSVQERTAWAKAHGYPNFPADGTTWARMSDSDEARACAVIKHQHYLADARQARERGDQQASAHYLGLAADARRSYRLRSAASRSR
jgi:hypothetical protein